MTTIRVNVPAGKAAQALQLIAKLPGVLSGMDPDPTGGGAARVRARVAQAALMYVRQAYVEKAAGRTDESGLAWKPLAPSTIARRRKGRRKGGQVQILRDTGLLLNSLAFGHELAVLIDRPGSVVIGTTVRYASAHHLGGPGLPQRRLWPEPRRWPQRWTTGMALEAARGAVALLAEALR